MEKKRFGIISYNIYCNFTNYGSALQSWALSKAIDRVPNCHAVLVDYCSEVLTDKNPLNPFKICGIRMKNLRKCENLLCLQ